jgi:hypothetical protein
MHFLLKSGVAAAMLIGSAVAGSAQTPFYEGKTIKAIVGFSPGGGTDFVGRLVMENLEQYIDGDPTIIVENMPGASSVLASNYYVDRAPRDGTEIFVGTGQLLMRIVLGLEGSTASLADLEPVMALPMGRITFGRTVDGINGPKDLLDPPTNLVLGVPEVISTVDAVLGLELLGAEYQAVIGYEGKSEAFLAFERGESNLDSQSTPVYLQQPQIAVEEGRAVPLFAQGFMNGNGELIRDPATPDIPTVAEVYTELHGEAPEGPAWEAYKAAVTAIGNGGKIILIHSEAPDEAKAAIYEAVEELLADKEFQAAAEAAAEGYSFTYGEELNSAVRAVANMSEDDLQWLRDFFSENYEMTFN